MCVPVAMVFCILRWVVLTEAELGGKGNLTLSSGWIEEPGRQGFGGTVVRGGEVETGCVQEYQVYCVDTY